MSNMLPFFQLQATDGAARAGLLATPHGAVPTPAFIPVATQGSVKTVTPQELRDLGATIVLGNTYHLYLRPGVELVREMGGLSAFMGWDGPTITDSGGFQALLQELGAKAPTKPPRRGWPAGLTDREVEVLQLAARGLTKRQVGEQLVISEKTVDHHLEHIYTKIDVSSRAAATLFAVEHDLLA